jgi:PST family polysaccharide transporter
MAAATTFLGMSPSWFGIGAGDPWLLFWYDTLPRVVAAVAGAVLVAATGWISLYPMLLAVSVAVSLVAFRRRVTPGARDTMPWPPARAVGELRHHLGTAGINLAATAYASTPVPVATFAFRPDVSSPFASADAAYRLGLFTVTAMGNAFQGWTLETGLGADERRSRHRSALWAHVVLGVVGGGLFAALAPWVTGLLFGSDVAAPRDVCVWYGVAFLFLSVSTPPIRNLLVPARRVRLVLGWTVGSAVVGLLLMIAAAVAGWSAGVAAGMAVSEAVLLAGLVGPSLRVSRTSRAAGS